MKISPPDLTEENAKLRAASVSLIDALDRASVEVDQDGLDGEDDAGEKDKDKK